VSWQRIYNSLTVAAAQVKSSFQSLILFLQFFLNHLRLASPSILTTPKFISWQAGVSKLNWLKGSSVLFITTGQGLHRKHGSYIFACIRFRGNLFIHLFHSNTPRIATIPLLLSAGITWQRLFLWLHSLALSKHATASSNKLTTEWDNCINDLGIHLWQIPLPYRWCFYIQKGSKVG
jgi:hypothetical protein